ncbi:MAG: type II methionyl aminopeptidase [Desulfurococcaceae archaeon]
MLGEEAISKLLKAGEIAKKALERATKITRPGVRVLDVVNSIENYIRELGGAPAFPVNVGINSVAAHYTPPYGNNLVIPENSVVKVDVGVHVDGYIADTAATLAFNPVYEGLVDAPRRALERAIEVVRPGVRASEVGRIVEEVIKSSGFKPIKNLSGHGIERYRIHSGFVIPNYNDHLNRQKIGEGVYAVEPFATNGAGLVRELNSITIYALKPTSRPLPAQVKDFYEMIYRERRELPFTTRWYIRGVEGVARVQDMINGLRKARCLVEYPVLVERNNGIVTQFEHTIVVTEKDVIVITA